MVEAAAVALVRASTEKPMKDFFAGGGGGEEVIPTTTPKPSPSPSPSPSLSEAAGMEELRLGGGVSVLVLVFPPLTSSARRRRFLAVPPVSFREYVFRGGALLDH